MKNMGEAKLCLPTVHGTLLSSLLVSAMFTGLVALSFRNQNIWRKRGLVDTLTMLACLGVLHSNPCDGCAFAAKLCALVAQSWSHFDAGT